VFHLDLGSFNFPLVRLGTQSEDGGFVMFWHRVLQVGDETGRLLGVMMYKLRQCVELVLRCYVQLQHSITLS